MIGQADDHLASLNGLPEFNRQRLDFISDVGLDFVVDRLNLLPCQIFQQRRIGSRRWRDDFDRRNKVALGNGINLFRT